MSTINLMATVTSDQFAAAYSAGFKGTVSFIASRGVLRELAEEIAQAAWSTGWEKRHQLDKADALGGWVNAIAFNSLRSYFRKMSTRQTIELPIGDLPAGWRMDTRVEAAIDVGRLLNRLPPHRRAYMQAFYMEEAGSQPLNVRVANCRSMKLLRQAVSA